MAVPDLWRERHEDEQLVSLSSHCQLVHSICPRKYSSMKSDRLKGGRIEKQGVSAANFNTIPLTRYRMGTTHYTHSRRRHMPIQSNICKMPTRPTQWSCISNCDKVTPGMLMAAMRLNIRQYSFQEARWNR
ncbi:dihydroxy-acid dehydratase domain-containing protein [Duncaniella dubosii]|uniref:dihydroxy-acid dehydratase domain-containing protein n=1 Tax=Duncaniella dubosii TaxID=2518971 RepID=UPI003F67E680